MLRESLLSEQHHACFGETPEYMATGWPVLNAASEDDGLHASDHVQLSAGFSVTFSYCHRAEGPRLNTAGSDRNVLSCLPHHRGASLSVSHS